MSFQEEERSRDPRDGHVTKRAVNNADGQCCELRWYQTHKRHGFMLAATRRGRPHSAIIRVPSSATATVDDADQPRCHGRVLFFSVIGAFSGGDSCDPVPAETPLCRNKVTLLPVTLRSGTLTRAFLRSIRRCATTPVYIDGGISRDIKDITVIDARGTHGRQAN